MFKSRIKKWQLEKNNKESDMAFVLFKAAEREASGKTTVFHIREQQVTGQEVNRYLRRKKIKPESLVQKLPRRPKTPPYVSYRTPLSSPSATHHLEETSQSLAHTSNPDVKSKRGAQNTPTHGRNRRQVVTVPRMLEAPMTMLIPEVLFREIQDYYDRSFHTSLWRIEPDTKELVSSKPGGSNIDALHKFTAYGDSATVALANAQFESARRLLSKACGTVPALLRAEYPETLDFILQGVLKLIETGCVEMAAMLVKYLNHMASTIFKAGHLWIRIFRLLAKVELTQLEAVARQCWECIISRFNEHLGPSDAFTTDSYLRFVQQNYGFRDLRGAELRLRDHLLMCERSVGRDSHVALTTSVILSHNVYNQGRYEEAEFLDINVAKRACARREYELEINAMRYIAFSQYQLGKWIEAEATLRDAIQEVEKIYGPAHPALISFLQELERWLRNWGRVEEADGLKTQLLTLAWPDDVDETRTRPFKQMLLNCATSIELRHKSTHTSEMIGSALRSSGADFSFFADECETSICTPSSSP
jgi:hypothetical protein